MEKPKQHAGSRSGSGGRRRGPLSLLSVCLLLLGSSGGWGGEVGEEGAGGAVLPGPRSFPVSALGPGQGRFSPGALKHGTANVRADGHRVSFFSCLGL